MEQKELQKIFEQINTERTEISRLSEPLQEQIAALENEISILIAPHAAVIDALKEDITIAVMMDEKSVKTDAGGCSFIRGRKPSIKWDDAALNGYAVDHEDILQFRSEGKPGKPGVRFNLKEI